MKRTAHGAGLSARPAASLLLAIAVGAACNAASGQVLDTVVVFRDSDKLLRMDVATDGKLAIHIAGDSDRLCLLACPAASVVGSFPLDGSGTQRVGSFNWRRNKYYYTNQLGGLSLGIIDCATDSLTRKIYAGGFYGIAYNSTMDRIYTTDDTAWVVDCSTDSVVGHVAPHAGTFMAAWDSVGNKLYTGGGLNADWLYVIDCALDTVKGRINGIGVKLPTQGSVAPLHRRLYVASWNTDSGVIIDCAADRRVRTLVTGTTNFTPLVLEGMGKVYWAGGTGENVWFTPGVTVIDIAGDSILRRILAPETVWGRIARNVAYAEWNNRLYSLWRWRSNQRPGGWGYIGVIDCATDSVLAWVPFANWPIDIVCNPYDHRIYVTCANESLYVFRDELPGVAEAQTAPVKELRIHPNPARDWLELQSSAPADLIAIDGRRVAVLAPGRNDVRSLPAGVYVCRQRGATGASSTKVVLRQ